MINILAEINVIVVFLSLVVGYQLAFYFLVQYLKNRNLKYGKLLLSYFFITSIALVSHIFQSARIFFNLEGEASQFFYKISTVILMGAIVIYLILSNQKDIYTKKVRYYSRIIVVLLILSMVVLWILPFNFLTLVFFFYIEVTLAGLNAFYFQIILIKISRGEIRRRLNIFNIGFFFILSGFVINSYFLRENPILDVNIVSTSLMLSGFIIVFIGVINFPAFLEFHWKENLYSLLIFDRRNLKILYNFSFKDLIKINNKNKDNQLFSRSITGIDHILGEITHQKDEKINIIDRGDYVILLESADFPLENITYALIAKENMHSLRYFLANVKIRFHELFREVLVRLRLFEGKEEKIFSAFDAELIRELEINGGGK